MTQVELREALSTLDSHAPGERMHGERVAVYAVSTAHTLGWPPEALTELRFAAALHDLGKLSVPADLLQLRDRPSGEQVLELRRHVEVPALALTGLRADWIRSHHERWDGNGYPSGLHGGAIPKASRVIAVAETFDVLANDGRWRRTMGVRGALEEIQRGSGSQFDPEVVAAFLKVQPLIQPLALS